MMFCALFCAVDPTYSVMLFLCSSMSATYFRLRFAVCAAVTWSLFVLYVTLAAATGDWQGTGGEQAHDFVFVVLLLFVGNVIYTHQAYNREFFIRLGFLAGNSLVRRHCGCWFVYL